MTEISLHRWTSLSILLRTTVRWAKLAQVCKADKLLKQSHFQVSLFGISIRHLRGR